MSSQMPPPALPPSTGLTRTRSLRRPQIGVSAVTSSMAPPSLAARKLPSPSKQLPAPGSIGTAATRTASATMTAAPGPTMNSRISSGVMPGRLRRTATISASTTTTTMAPRMANTSPTRSASTRSMATRTTATSTASSSASTTSTSASSRYYPPSTSAVLRRPNSSDEPPSPTTALPGPAVPNGRLTRTATLPSTRSSGGAGGYHARTRSTTVTRGPSPLSTVSTTTTMTSKMSKPAKPAKTAKTAKTAPSATVLTAATVLRPPSAESSSASSSTTTATTTTNASTSASRKSRTTPPASASASTTARTVGPSASLHRRPRSATVGSTSAPSSSASVSASASTSSSRPAFSTLQQHYSPAKSLAPKPRTAAILAPPSPSKRPANVALSAETARLQTVLLQLHLLHRDSAATTAAWHASARELLGRRFAALVAADAELARAAAVQAERVNAAALRRWTGGGSHSLDENVQALDEVLAGVWSLAVGAGMIDSSDHHHGNKNNNSSSSSSSNRYGRVVRRFERWAERTAALVEARRQAVKSLEEGDQSADDEDDDDDGSSLLLLLPGEGHKDPALVLDAAWHADCANLTRKLEGWQRQLDMLGDGDMVGGGGGGCEVDGDGDGENNKNAASSLGRILGGCRRLVDDMLAELNVMQQLEQDAAEQELAWIRRMNSALDGSDSINSIRAAPRAGAVWRVM